MFQKFLQNIGERMPESNPGQGNIFPATIAQEITEAVFSGFSLAAAVQDRLPVSQEAFCRAHDLNVGAFSEVVNGKRLPDARQTAALIKVFGGSHDGWIEVWFIAAKRRALLSRTTSQAGFSELRHRRRATQSQSP